MIELRCELFILMITMNSLFFLLLLLLFFRLSRRSLSSETNSNTNDISRLMSVLIFVCLVFNIGTDFAVTYENKREDEEIDVSVRNFCTLIIMRFVVQVREREKKRRRENDFILPSFSIWSLVYALNKRKMKSKHPFVFFQTSSLSWRGDAHKCVNVFSMNTDEQCRWWWWWRKRMNKWIWVVTTAVAFVKRTSIVFFFLLFISQWWYMYMHIIIIVITMRRQKKVNTYEKRLVSAWLSLYEGGLTISISIIGN